MWNDCHGVEWASLNTYFFLEFENWVGRVDLVITNVKCHPSVRCKTIFFRLFENMSLRKSPIQLHISTMDSSHWTVFYGYQFTFPNTQRQQKNIGFESTNKHHGIMISIHFLPHTIETRIWSVFVLLSVRGSILLIEVFIEL